LILTRGPRRRSTFEPTRAYFCHFGGTQPRTRQGLSCLAVNGANRREIIRVRTFSQGVPSDALATGPMPRVSVFVEMLRARPALLFWTATLGQASAWILVPALFYGAPPGVLPLVLEIGHGWPLGSAFGPPLANWAAELAFDLAGHHVFGIYVLSQLCLVVTFWAVWALGRSIVGPQHAVIAVLLMTGITAFSVPMVAFGPSVLATPLTAFALLHYWRAVGQASRHNWFYLGVDLGLLILTTYAGLILIVLIGVFAIINPRARAAFATVEPWIAGMIVIAFAFPHLIWIDRVGQASPSLAAIAQALLEPRRVLDGLAVIAWILMFHAGFLALVIVAVGIHSDPRSLAPAFRRAPVDDFAKSFIYFFACLPALVSTVVSITLQRPTPVGGVAPLVVLSGLAVVTAFGDVIRLHRQGVLWRLWVGLLLLPPTAAIAAVVVLPWTGIGLEADRPANAMARFFTDAFRHRTGHPLSIVVGDAEIGPLVVMASSDRPRLLLANQPQFTAFVTDADIRAKGAILVWALSGAAPAPPPSISARFPDLVVEVPQSFERPVQGRLPLYRVGWAMVRPGAQSGPAGPAAR
jgi:Dolichyl-phosphate-mannose-protein mannosyltransferase